MSIRTHRLAAGTALLLTCWIGGISATRVGGAPAEGPGALLSLTVGGTPGQVVIELTGTAALRGKLETVGTPPDRLFVDLPNVRPEVPGLTEVNLGAVKRVRVALNQAFPPITRVVLDIDRATRFDIAQGRSDRELRIVVESDVAGVKAQTATESYVAWFTRTAAAITGLIDVTSNALGSGAMMPREDLALEWETLRHHLEAVTPPPELAKAHELLVTAGSVARAALGGSPAQPFAARDVASATAGAALLVRQAEGLAAAHLSPSGPEPALP